MLRWNICSWGADPGFKMTKPCQKVTAASLSRVYKLATRLLTIPSMWAADSDAVVASRKAGSGREENANGRLGPTVYIR